LGGARERGETHQWMYDRVNLSAILRSNGFTDIKVQDYDQSDIPNWSKLALDVDAEGNQYKKLSLYMEATKSK
jgi:hypothetical protein